MTEPPVDTVEVGASPAEIWAILDDPAALGRILPGCESIAREAPDRYVAVLASKVQFMTIRSDVVATLHDADPPHHLRLVLEGRPRGLGGSFRCEVPFDIVPNGAAGSRVAYSVGLTLGGSLAGFGGKIAHGHAPRAGRRARPEHRAGGRAGSARQPRVPAA